MPPKVSLILIISNDEKDLIKQCFDSLGFAIEDRYADTIEEGVYKQKCIAHLSIELLIANRDVATLEKGIFDIYQPLSTIYLGGAGSNDGNTYDYLIKQATGEYVCIIQPQMLLDDLWLCHLVDYYEYIPQSGIISITTTPEKHSLSTLLNNEDSFTHILYAEEYLLKNIYFFKRDRLLNFPITPHPQMLDLLCLDAVKSGLVNYYVTTTFGIPLV